MRFGIIGTNFISDRFADAAKKSGGASVTAIYSRGADTGNNFAKKHGVEKVYTSYNEMLCDKDIDAIYVASPTMLHFEHTVEALRAKKHVLCEKMLAANYAEGELMAKEAKLANKILIEAMRPDFDPIIQKAKEVLPLLGTIQNAYFEFCQRSSRYDSFLHGDTPNAFNSKMKNSALSDIGIYPLHVAIDILGIPKRFNASGIKIRGDFLAEGEITLEYDGFSAKVVYSKVHEGKNVSFINSERATLSFGRINEPEFMKILNTDGTESLYTPNQDSSNMVNEIKEFVSLAEAPDGSTRADSLLSVSLEALKIADEIHKQLGYDF